MNLLCPNCQKMISVPDQHAGQAMKCPLCGNTFQAPNLPGAATSAVPASAGAGAASSPGPASSAPVHPDVFRLAPEPAEPPRGPEAQVPSGPPGPTPPEPPLDLAAGLSPPTGYHHRSTIWISPRVVPWVAPAGLVVVFFLLFCAWVEWPGHPEVSQSGWGTAFGKYFTGLGLLYVLLFILSLLAAVAAVVVPHVHVTLPRAVQQLWPWRSGFVAGLALLSFVFLVLELSLDFGLEKEAQAHQVPVLAGAEADFLYSLLHRTVWLRLAVLLHLIAVIGATLEFWLALRKNRPLPRVDIFW